MANIIAARFQTFPEAETAVSDLQAQGMPSDHLSVVYVNTAGQHAAYAIGGDEKADEGAKDADKGAAAGAFLGGAAGAVLGAATAAVPGVPLAAAVAATGVGAYTGALAGALNKSGQDEQSPGESAPVVRSAGVMLAVCLDGGPGRESVIEVLRQRGGLDIEAAQGEWRDGQWASFNPVEPPALIDPPGRTGG